MPRVSYSSRARLGKRRRGNASRYFKGGKRRRISFRKKVRRARVANSTIRLHTVDRSVVPINLTVDWNIEPLLNIEYDGAYPATVISRQSNRIFVKRITIKYMVSAFKTNGTQSNAFSHVRMMLVRSRLPCQAVSLAGTDLPRWNSELRTLDYFNPPQLKKVDVVRSKSFYVTPDPFWDASVPPGGAPDPALPRPPIRSQTGSTTVPRWGHSTSQVYGTMSVPINKWVNYSDGAQSAIYRNPYYLCFLSDSSVGSVTRPTVSYKVQVSFKSIQ